MILLNPREPLLWRVGSLHHLIWPDWLEILNSRVNLFWCFSVIHPNWPLLWLAGFRSHQPEDVCCASLWRNRGEATSLLHLFISSLSICMCVKVVLPPAGGQWHGLEWDALVSGSPHGGRLSHWAGLQSGGRGAEGNTWRDTRWSVNQLDRRCLTCPSLCICFWTRTALQWCVRQVTTLRSPLPCQYTQQIRSLHNVALWWWLTTFSMCIYVCPACVCVCVCVCTGGSASLIQ